MFPETQGYKRATGFGPVALGCCPSRGAETPPPLPCPPRPLRPGRNRVPTSGERPSSKACSHWSNNPHGSSTASTVQTIIGLNWRHLGALRLPEEARRIARPRDRGSGGQNSNLMLCPSVSRNSHIVNIPLAHSKPVL